MPESTRFDKSFAFVFSENLEDWIKSTYLKRCKTYRENYIRKGKRKKDEKPKPNAIPTIQNDTRS